MKNNSNMFNTYSSMVLSQEAKLALFKDIKERGWPSPFSDFMAPSPPLKSLKISVVKRPKHKNLGSQQNSTKMSLFKV